MAGPQQIRPNVFAAAQQIASPSSCPVGTAPVSACPPVEHGQLAGIPSVRLDAITRPPRNQRGRDDVGRHLAPRQIALQLKPAGPRFVVAPCAAPRDRQTAQSSANPD